MLIIYVLCTYLIYAEKISPVTCTSLKKKRPIARAFRAIYSLVGFIVFERELHTNIYVYIYASTDFCLCLYRLFCFMCMWEGEVN